MSDLDYDALRKVAEGATPGPWEAQRPGFTFNASVTKEGAGEAGIDMIASVDWVAECGPHEGDGKGIQDAEHIATFDPPTVLRLLDIAQRAEADRAAVERVRALAADLESRADAFGDKARRGGYDHLYRNHAMRIRAALDPKEDQ